MDARTLLDQLFPAGHDVRCLVRDPTRLDGALSSTDRERVDVAVGDVLDVMAV